MTIPSPESLPPADAPLEPALQVLVGKLGAEVFSEPGRRGLLVSACTNLFSDGELHPNFDKELPPDSPLRPWLVGESHLFEARMSELAAREPDYVAKLELDMAVAAAETALLPEGGGSLQPLVDVDVDAEGQWGIRVGDGAVHALDQPPKVVIDFGPGVRGQTFIDRQFDQKRRGHQPPAYIGIAKGNFVPMFLQRYLQGRLAEDRGGEVTAEDLQEYSGGTFAVDGSGIAAFTDELAGIMKGRSMADVVVCSWNAKSRP